MELDRISDYKIKVTLSGDELLRYGLQVDDTADRDRVRMAVSDLLFDLGEPVQDPLRERLLLAIHTAEGGGAELFITRLPLSAERQTNETALGFFSFPTVAVMRRAEGAVTHRFGDLDISLYRAALGGYILSLPLTPIDGISPAELLLEFGEREKHFTAPLSPEWYSPLGSED